VIERQVVRGQHGLARKNPDRCTILLQVDQILRDRPDEPAPLPSPMEYLSGIQGFLEIEMGSRDRGVQRSTFNVQRSKAQLPFGVRRSPFAVYRLPFAVHRSPFTVRRSPFTVRRSPFAVRRSAFAVSSAVDIGGAGSEHR
jgi:hypothetical protein